MASEYWVVYRKGPFSSIHGTSYRGRCFPNIKNMIFYPLDRGLLHVLLPFLVRCDLYAMASHLNVHMSCRLRKMCSYSHGFGFDILSMHIDTIVHPLQAKSAASHDDSTTREETNPASRAQHIKDRIRIPAVISVAFLNPEPVGDGNATADT